MSQPYIRKRCKCEDHSKCHHSWYYTVELPKDPVTGGRNQKTKGGFKTERECLRAALKVEEDVEKGINVSVPKLEDYILKYMNSTVKNNVEVSTYTQQMYYVENFIIPRLGKNHMDKIKYEMVDDFYNKLLEEGNSRSVIKTIAMILRKTFTFAESREVILRNVVRAVKHPKYKPARFKVWDKEQVKTFINGSKILVNHAAYVLGLTGGMRLGELLGLKWTDINYLTGRISFNHIVKYDKVNKLHLQEYLKTDPSRRTITMPLLAMEALKNHQMNSLPHEMVFHNFGNLIYPSEMSRRWTEDVKKTTLPQIRFHDMRHTHATLLLADGVTPRAVAERLGHSNINTLMNTYAHVLPEMEQDIADRLDKMVDYFEENLDTKPVDN